MTQTLPTIELDDVDCVSDFLADDSIISPALDRWDLDISEFRHELAEVTKIYFPGSGLANVLASMEAVLDWWPSNVLCLAVAPAYTLIKVWYTAPKRKDLSLYKSRYPEWFVPQITKGSWVWPPK